MSDSSSFLSPQRLSLLGPSDIGHHVRLHGWVYATRAQGAGKLVFVDLGDGSTVSPLRCIAVSSTYGSPERSDEAKGPYTLLTYDQMCQSSHLSIGCSVMLHGLVTAPPEGTTQAFEVKIMALYVIGGVTDPSKYPIQKSILKKPLQLRQHYHARFRAPLIQQYMRIRSEALFAVHEFFHQEDVPLLDPSIMTSSDCEGAGEVFKVSPQFFSSGAIAALGEGTDKDQDSTLSQPYHEVGLTVSSQLPLEAIAMGTGSVYTCQKSFRAEKSLTAKHLAEFLHIEFERYFIELPDLLTFTERLVKHLISKVLTRCTDQYKYFDSKLAPTQHQGHSHFLSSMLDKPFARITHADAIELMQQHLREKVKHIGESGKEVRLKFKVYPRHGEDLGAEHEKYLVQHFGTFVFVTHWPSAIKSFYMKQVGDGTCESFDLLAPLVGELFGGSMREWRYDVLHQEIEKRGMDMSPLQWFVDLRKDGTAPHGGWGMGFDRLVMFLTGASSVRDVVPYPVYYTHCPY